MAKHNNDNEEEVVEGNFKEVTEADPESGEVEEETKKEPGKVQEIWEKSKPVLRKVRNGLLCAAGGAATVIGVAYVLGKKEDASLSIETSDESYIDVEADPEEKE